MISTTYVYTNCLPIRHCRPASPLTITSFSGQTHSVFCMQVYAVIDTNKDGMADSVVTVVNNLAAPMGLAYANGSLWVATTPTIYRFANVDELALAGKVKH